MDSSHHSPSFVEKHNNRIKKQLEKLADLPKQFNCEEIDHPHFKLFKISICAETLSKQTIQQINKGQPINFEIILSDQYPFVMPQICCISNLSLQVNLNDRRNLISNIIGYSWGPAVIIKDAIEKIPSFLKEVYANRNNKKYLHTLGEFLAGAIFYKEDLLRSSLTTFDCFEIERNLIFLTNSRKSLITLSSSFLIVFETNMEKNHYILNKAYRLTERINIQSTGQQLQFDFVEHDQKRTFEFNPIIKHKEFQLLFSHLKQSAVAQDELVGSATGLLKSQIEKQIDKLQKQISERSEDSSNNCNERYQQLKRCLSDMIEISSVQSEERAELYKNKLIALFKNQEYLPKQ